MKNYANSTEYEKYIEQYDYIFDNKYFKSKEEFELTHNLRISIENYNHSYKITKNYGYSISCQNIILLDNARVSIYQLKMVFGKPFFQYIKHSNGNEYFVCGNDLLDFSIFNISENTEHRFVSEYIVNEETDEDCNNEFWYIKQWIYNPQNNLLAINGQDGMNCPTVTICDFSYPDQLPLNFINLNFRVSEFDKLCAENNIQYNGSCTAIGWSIKNEMLLNVNEGNQQTLILEERVIRRLLDSL